MTRPLTIGQVAREAGVGVETIRFYEREGLIDNPPRRPSGYRQYDRQAVRRIRFIRHAKELGFTLREIRQLLDVQIAPDEACGEVLELASAKIADIEQRIDTLREIREALMKLAAACRERRRSDPCPILDAMDPPADRGA